VEAAEGPLLLLAVGGAAGGPLLPLEEVEAAGALLPLNNRITDTGNDTDNCRCPGCKHTGVAAMGGGLICHILDPFH
jgi:hypothetical protein